MTALVSSLPLPTSLLETMRRTRDESLRQWMVALPAVVAEYAARWSLRLGAPYQPGGAVSWVAPARDAAGRELVLKVGWRHDEAQDEAAALRAWAGRGTVRLHASDTSATTSALLLERCDPGTTLGRTVPEVEQDLVLAELLHALWRAPTGGHPFRPLSHMCAGWAASFETRLAQAPDLLDPGLARAGIALFRDLSVSTERAALLCTDLHAGNVLAARREPWLVIDPKPYLGDPCYDVLQHMLNCRQRLSVDPRGLAHRVADLAGLDRDRVVAWLFARCVQESLDQAGLRPVAAALAPLI